MKESAFYIAACAFLLNCATANAATFRIETHARGYVLYSTFEKPEECQVGIAFTFMKNGVREEGASLCYFKPVPEGKDVEFCAFRHEQMVDPVMREPLEVMCKPSK